MLMHLIWITESAMFHRYGSIVAKNLLCVFTLMEDDKEEEHL